jgi:hypothetical protein
LVQLSCLLLCVQSVWDMRDAGVNDDNIFITLGEVWKNN